MPALSIDDRGPPPPCPAPFNLAVHVLARAEAAPDKIALAVVGPAAAERWSYARLDAAVRGVAAGLIARGLVPGDRVLLRLGNTVDFPLAFLGCIAAGLIPAPTLTQLTAPEITAMAKSLDPVLVIAGEGIALPDHPAPVLSTSDLRRFHDHPPADVTLGDPNRPAYILHTSGTSGGARAVLHAHHAVWARQMMIAGWYGLSETDRVLHAGAFNWSYTLGTGLLDPWAIGATALIPAEGTPPEMLPLLIKRHDVTIFAATPGHYRRLLRAPLPALPKLRHGLSAGEALPPALRAAWRKATRTDLHEAFGQSECSTFVSGSPDRPAPEGTMGYAQPGRRIAVLDEAGTPVPRGTPGILAIHRSDPGLMLGWFDGTPLPKDDWFPTGDSAVMAEDGALSYLGRADDLMNAGGHRVSPVEVESALTAHPAIAEAAAAEVTVKPGTTVIAAFYVADTPPDTAELEAWCAARLARYKTPRLFLRVDSLPRGANGKLLRRALRDGYDAQRTGP